MNLDPDIIWPIDELERYFNVHVLTDEEWLAHLVDGYEPRDPQRRQEDPRWDPRCTGMTVRGSQCKNRIFQGHPQPYRFIAVEVVGCGETVPGPIITGLFPIYHIQFRPVLVGTNMATIFHSQRCRVHV